MLYGLGEEVRRGGEEGRRGEGTDGGAGVSDEDFGFHALREDATGEGEVVEGEGGCPDAGNGWKVVSVLNTNRPIEGKASRVLGVDWLIWIVEEGRRRLLMEELGDRKSNV